MNIKYNFIALSLIFTTNNLWSQSIEIPNNILNEKIVSELNIPDIKTTSPKSQKDYDSESSLQFLNKNNNFDGLERFGSSFFLASPSTFLPINDPSSTSGYILDIDDVVLINLFGDESDSYEYKIDRSGNIFINKIGNINIVGLSLEQANSLANAKIKEYFVSTTVVISLKKVRDMQILVTGHVKNPGVYTVSGYSNILHTLILSGGISNNGSYRNVLLKRAGFDDIFVDLYDFFIFGDASSNLSLKSGDSIVVSSTTNNIPIVGAVSRPSIYEFLPGETTADLLGFAGGLTQYSNNKSIVLSRKKNNLPELINVSDDLSIPIVQNDRIYIGFSEYQPNIYSIASNNKFISNFVEISGEVKRPGRYFIQDGENLSDIILKFGGYTENADIAGGVRISQSARQKEISYNDKLFNEALKSIFNLSKKSQIQSVAPLTNLLEEFKKIKPSGRVITEFDHIKINMNPSADSKINYGDKIHIPAKSNKVFVFGEVLNPGVVLFKNDYNLQDYLNSAGGLTTFANKNNIIIVRPNGEAFRIKQIRRNIFGKAPPMLEPGSVIYISRDLTRVDGLDLAATISPIFSSLAISLASLNSINRN